MFSNVIQGNLKRSFPSNQIIGSYCSGNLRESTFCKGKGRFTRDTYDDSAERFEGV